jgi:glycosyltransferase involved in cell wall biosynthesis
MEKLINLYQQGRLAELLSILKDDESDLGKAFFNFVDAAVFENIGLALRANIYLQEFFPIFKEDAIKMEDILTQQPDVTRPYLPISYPGELQREGPVLIMEPLELDWKAVLDAPTILWFYDAITMWQCLQFEEVGKALSKPGNIFFVGGVYPNETLSQQKFAIPSIKGKGELSKAIVRCLQQYQGNIETEAADCLYLLGQRMYVEYRFKQLGERRSLGLKWQSIYRLRCSAHKRKNNTLTPFLEQSENRIIERCVPISPVKRQRKDRINLAHVTSLIRSNKQHAPSRILKSFLQHHDPQKYKLHVYSHEFLFPRMNEYPYLDIYADSSRPYVENFLAEQDIYYYIADNLRRDYIQTACDIAEDLSRQDIDVVIIHEMSPIAAILAHVIDVPHKIYFGHGWPEFPQRGDFDLMIFSNEELAQQAKKYGKTAFHNFAVDCRGDWHEAPCSKEYFGLKEDNKILTTISNHLETRLSDDMCWAVGEILRCNPRAYYMPIGKKPSNAEEILDKIGVVERVVFLGDVNNPSHLARSCDLYLNEFPLGSGLGILDAMASGTPVVSMYDKKGPSASRYGGIYMGVDKGISSCEINDYAALACRLLQNEKMYKSWSWCALRRYEEICNVAKYVRYIENLIEI